MRLFVACEIDEAIRERLGQVIDDAMSRIDGVKWVDVANIHITLKFLGEVQDTAVEGISDALDGVLSDTRSFPMCIRGLGAFPPKGSPKVVWAGVGEGAEGVVSLNDAVERSLQPAGFEREKRPFSPHATLGRARKNARPRGLKELVDRERSTSFGSQQASRVILMKSMLTPDGPIYTPVRVWNTMEE